VTRARLDCSSLNANESSWVGYRDLPPQTRFFFKYVRLPWVRSPPPWLTVPLELAFLARGGLHLVAGLRVQQFPDKTAQLPRDGHERLVTLESTRH
jgi:hypothetical protein